MNQAQRNFLIKKIEEKVNTTVKMLQSASNGSTPPSISMFLLHEVLSGRFEIKSTEALKEMIKAKALKANDRDDWMGNSWGSASKDKISFDAKDFFIVPDSFNEKWTQYREEEEKTRMEIVNLRVQADTLITRIQLASDKTLQTMINEVDDMGDISLMDTKLKLLSK